MALRNGQAKANANAQPTRLLELQSGMSSADALQRLRMNALAVHQQSMGHGDELVRILQATIRQLERSHNRVQFMSLTLFVAGLGVLGVGVWATVAGGHGVWSALLGGTGGVASLAAVFWTTPLDRVAASVTDLVKVEAAFLGYIRVIGEIDSFFQMQYLAILAEGEGAAVSLRDTMRDTTTQMREMMTSTVQLIDERVTSNSSSELRKSLEELQERLSELDREPKST